MSINFAKLIKAAGIVLLVSFSANSFASGYYGSVGYIHHPIKIVVGHNGHGNHYDRRSRYQDRHYRKDYKRNQNRYYDNRARYYNPPRRYCRSGY